MRELKFRTPVICQNGHKGYWHYRIDNIHDFAEITNSQPPKNICKCPKIGIGEGWSRAGACEQYTGRKDKNGVEIYEGDIVGFDDGTKDRTQSEFERWAVMPLGAWDCTCGDYYCSEHGVGFFVKGYHGYYRKNGGIDKYELTKTIADISEKCEVIGNIYQNPELLETK